MYPKSEVKALFFKRFIYSVICENKIKNLLYLYFKSFSIQTIL